MKLSLNKIYINHYIYNDLVRIGDYRYAITAKCDQENVEETACSSSVRLLEI